MSPGEDFCEKHGCRFVFGLIALLLIMASPVLLPIYLLGCLLEKIFDRCER